MDDDEEAKINNQESSQTGLEENPTTINFLIDSVNSLTINQILSNETQFDPQKGRRCLSDLQHKLRNFYRDVTLPCVSWMDDGRDLLISDFYVDVKLHTKSNTIDIKEIFSNAVSGIKPTRILLEGQPGFGKTAFSTKLIFDWATAKDYLREFDFAFLIPLRQLRGKSVEDAIEEISKLCGFRDYETTWNLIENNLSKTLLIFDGFDEIAKLAREHIFQILYKQLYEEITVVVTCRTDLFDIRRHEVQALFGGIPMKKQFYDKLIIISGIEKDNREKFLRKFSTECDTKIILNFIGKTSCHDILNSPLFLIFLALFAVKKKTLLNVTTQTEFYRNLINCIIRRSAERKNIFLDENFDIFDNNSCSSDVYAKNFYEFGVLSFTKILEETFQFECNELSKKIYDMGFLTHHKNLLFFNSTRSYEPFHLSFLEFSCAFALKRDFESNNYQLNAELLDKILKINRECEPTSLIFPFLFGLLEKKSDIMFQQMKPFAHKIFFEQSTFWSIIAECQLGLPLIADFSPPVITHRNAKFAKLNWTPFCKSVVRNSIKRNKIFSVETELKFISRLPLDIAIRNLNMVMENYLNFNDRDVIHFKNIQCDRLIFRLNYGSTYDIDPIVFVFKLFCLKPVKKKYLYLNDSYGYGDLIKYVEIDVLKNLKLTKLNINLLGPSKNGIKLLHTLLGNDQVKSLALILKVEDCSTGNHANAPEYSFSSILNNIAKSDYLDSLDLQIKSDYEENEVDLNVLSNGGCKNWQELILHDSKLICSGHLKNPSCIRCLSTNSSLPETANTISKLDLKFFKCFLSFFSTLPVNMESTFRCENIEELSLTLDDFNENVNTVNILKLINNLDTFRIVLSSVNSYLAKYIRQAEYIVECMSLICIKRFILCWFYLDDRECCIIKALMFKLKSSSVLNHLVSIDFMILSAVDEYIRNSSLPKDFVDAISILVKCLEVNSINLKEINLILDSNNLWQSIVRRNIIDFTVLKVDQCLLEYFEDNLFKYKLSLIQQPVLSSSDNFTIGDVKLHSAMSDDFSSYYCEYFYR